MRLVATSKTVIKPQNLPPSERAAYFHSLRVHLQVIEWKSLMNIALHPIEWGWTLRGNNYEPIMTDLDPAPENILKLVRCNCKSIKNLCGTNACTCRRTGISCISACGQCNGKDCNNTMRQEIDESVEETELNIFESSIWN